MTKLTILCAAAALSMLAATPVFAEGPLEAIQYPGAVQSIYRNADVLHAGVRAPAQRMGARAFLPPGRSHAYGGHHQRRHVVRAGY